MLISASVSRSRLVGFLKGPKAHGRPLCRTRRMPVGYLLVGTQNWYTCARRKCKEPKISEVYWRPTDGPSPSASCRAEVVRFSLVFVNHSSAAWPRFFKRIASQSSHIGCCPRMWAGLNTTKGLSARKARALAMCQVLEGRHPAAVQSASVSVNSNGAAGSYKFA